MKTQSLWIALSSGLILSGCVGGMHQSTLDGLTGGEGTGAPFVEAFIEYRGPNSKWAGPATLTMHINAREQFAVIAVSPELTKNEGGPETAQRNLAHAAQLPAEEARKELDQLGAALHLPDQPFQGCMYPVRARMIRSDGSLVDKVGCRNEKSWTKTASQLVAKMMNYRTPSSVK